MQSYTANLSKNEFELHFDVTSFGMFWAIQDIIENRYLTMNAFLVTIGLTSVFIVFADFWRYPMSFSVGENADSPPSKSKMGEGAAVNSVASTALPDVLPAGEKHTPGSSKKILLLLYTFGQNLVSCSQLENPRFRQYVLWFLQAHTWNLM